MSRLLAVVALVLHVAVFWRILSAGQARPEGMWPPLALIYGLMALLTSIAWVIRAPSGERGVAGAALLLNLLAVGLLFVLLR